MVGRALAGWYPRPRARAARRRRRTGCQNMERDAADVRELSIGDRYYLGRWRVSIACRNRLKPRPRVLRGGTLHLATARLPTNLWRRRDPAVGMAARLRLDLDDASHASLVSCQPRSGRGD